MARRRVYDDPLDQRAHHCDGFGVARALQQQRLAVAVVFLTLHSEEDMFQAALGLGAKGYILKESAVDEVVQGIKTVANGQHFVTPALTGYLLNRRQRAQQLGNEIPGLASLTPTEQRVLQLVATNQSSKEIADALFIHYRTVENHRTNICQKLGLSGSNALLKFALQNKDKL